MCGQVLSPTTQDEDLVTPGFQYRTIVNNSDPSADVTLTIRPSGGGAPVYMQTDTGVTTIVNFPAATFGAGGMLDLEATATDSAGNVGRSPACAVTVMDLPSVVITQPTMGQVLGSTDDCSAGRSGLQVRVRGTSDAPAGSMVTVRVGTMTATTTVSASGRFNVCADADEGPAVTITAEVADPRGTGSASVVVAIDTMPPTVGIDPVTATIVDRRDGIVRFQWTAVADGVGSTPLASYELRCASTPITTDMEWSDARAIPMTTVPGTPGTVEREEVNAFRPGEDLFCVLRGADAGGGLTPWASNTTISIPFMTHVVDGAGTTGFGDELAMAGDLNGDMIDDVLTGGEMGTAYLWYGSATGLATAPSVTFSSSAAGFGNEVIGLGDFNGDGRNDFAIAAPNASSNQGRVFVFFGRATGSPFPASCNVDLPTCAPDVTLDRPAGLSGMGSEMSTSDFDGDGVNDLILSGVLVSSFTGEVYVVRGGSHLTSGSSFIVSAGSAMAPSGFLIPAPSGATSFGNGIAGLGGSVIGDARHDIVIGAPGFSAPANLVLVAGQAHSGGAMDVVPSSAITIIASDVQGRFSVVSPAGDTDGDGILDVRTYSPVGASSGSTTTWLGGVGGFSTTRIVTIRNDAPGDRDADAFGLVQGAARHAFFGNVGDIDRDGLLDVFFGSQQYGDVLHGSADLFYGQSPAVNRTRSQATPSLQGTDGTRQVGFVGDIDGDGFNDMGIGEASANGGAGRLILVY